MNKEQVADQYEVHTFIWQEIEIELTYWPLKWNAISHLEIRSIKPERAPLPITETGYKSHFFQPESVEFIDGSLVETVIQELDERAKSKEWLDFVEASRQGDLFD